MFSTLKVHNIYFILLKEIYFKFSHEMLKVTLTE